MFLAFSEKNCLFCWLCLILLREEFNLLQTLDNNFILKIIPIDGFGKKLEYIFYFLIHDVFIDLI